MKAFHKLSYFLALVSIFLVLFSSFAFSHEESEKIPEFLEKQDSLLYTGIASAVIAVFVLISIFLKKKSEVLKWILLIGISLPAILLTIYLTSTTIYLNVKSETNGPVHWHADFEVWKCGQKLDLKDPEGLLNRIGSPKFHEHNDNRIHVEGTLFRKNLVDLHNFFKIVGGSLSKESATIPTNDGPVTIESGEFCDGKEAKLQVFLYQITNPDPYSRTGFLYEQVKLDDFENYIMSPYINIPPGDCIIIEYDEEKQSTEKICESYKVAIENGDLAENGS